MSAGSELRTVRVRIEGRVQGVGYRYWTERVAGELGFPAGCATAATARSRRCSLGARVTSPRCCGVAATVRRLPK